MTEWELSQAISEIDPKHLKSIRVFDKTRPSWRYLMKQSVKFAIAAAVVILLVAGFSLPNLLLKPNVQPGNSTGPATEQNENRTSSLPELPEEDAEGPITVFLDKNYHSMFRELIDTMEEVEGKDIPEYRLIGLPDDPEERNIQLTQMRVELMAGGGFDLYLVTGQGYPADNFFTIPEKAMEADLFYPMDKLIEQSKYFSADELNPAVMAAGKTEQGQLILPLVYTYSLTSLENVPEDYHSFQAIAESTDEIFRSKFNEVLSSGSPVDGFCYSFSKLADYKAEKLLVTEEEIAEHLKVARDLQTNSSGSSSWGSNRVQLTPRFDKGPKSDGQTLIPLYNEEGGLTAMISMYAAINRNSEHILGSFALLDFMLSDEIVSGEGVFTGYIENKQTYEFMKVHHSQKFYSFYSGIPVKDGILSDSFSNMKGEKDLQAIDAYNREITSCRFVSTLDVSLGDARWMVYDATDEEIDRIAADTYQEMKMLLQE